MSYILVWAAWSVGIFIAVVIWRRIFPAPMPGLFDPTLDTSYRRRHFSPEVAAERHGLAAGMRALEIGPAGGYLTRAAVRKVQPTGHLVSLDLQQSLLRKLRARLGPDTPPLVRGDATRLPFRSGSFDLIFLSSVLGEIPDKPGAMREFGRVLRPGGTLAVSEEIIFDPDYVRLPVARRLAAGAGFEAREYFGETFRYTQRFGAPATSEPKSMGIVGSATESMRCHIALLAAVVAIALIAAACGAPGQRQLPPPPIIPPKLWVPGAGTPTSIQKWDRAFQPPAVVAFFDGLFDRVGIRVKDTGETFTCIHHGDRILFSDELDESSVDFVVQLESSQIDWMIENMKTGELGEIAKFRIMAVLAAPATEAVLNRPIIKNEWLAPLLYRIGGVQLHMQVVLVGPPGEAEVGYTIDQTPSRTFVIPGLHGATEPRYRLTVDDAVTYQRRMLAARRANSFWTWIRFARWYREFTKKVKVPPSRPVFAATPPVTARNADRVCEPLS